jgi:hypothetical protein
MQFFNEAYAIRITQDEAGQDVLIEQPNGAGEGGEPSNHILVSLTQIPWLIQTLQTLQTKGEK